MYIYIYWHIIAIFFCHADEDNKLLKNCDSAGYISKFVSGFL